MYTILFDGVCNLCNASINFILDRDKNHKFIFASLQSEAGRQILEKYCIILPKDGYDSIILIKNTQVYKKSGAVLEIAKSLGGFWSVLYIFIIFPLPIRNLLYDLIAKNRYRLFGKTDSCRMPTPELKQKFL